MYPCITLYINNSLHLARKYARIFVRGHYLFREANSFPRAKLEENCELRETDNVQGQISEDIFKAKLRLLCLLSFKYFSQQAGSCQSVMSTRQSLSIGFQNRVIQYSFPEFRTDFASVKRICLGGKVQHFSERKTYFFNCVDTSGGYYLRTAYRQKR